jgi:hypothetical protein
VSDADSPKNAPGAGLASSIVERAAAAAIAGLRKVQPGAADTLARALDSGALLAPLSPKPLGKLATELLDSLSGSAGDAD